MTSKKAFLIRPNAMQSSKKSRVLTTAPFPPLHNPPSRLTPGPGLGEEAPVFGVGDGALVLVLGRHRDDPEPVELNVRLTIERHEAVADVQQPDFVGEVVAVKLTLEGEG
jgi:hypothetical protein